MTKDEIDVTAWMMHNCIIIGGGTVSTWIAVGQNFDAILAHEHAHGPTFKWSGNTYKEFIKEVNDWHKLYLTEQKIAQTLSRVQARTKEK